MGSRKNRKHKIQKWNFRFENIIEKFENIQPIHP